ncbi:uncharacterized protein BP5553_01365 [Venustampulla echinocandica]|uniref:MARVEL domain-containing protein n=1 Tax=Venustampulla echinocandica TaxID=2656787 RepID=A0A370U0T3_9HELO|nr:uncharacterized protein BP5553_01365 [Venustampulla echinocandica]RDL41386.1 hypothetical protein BP5553_01365 [Venustampulla echinocandica]
MPGGHDIPLHPREMPSYSPGMPFPGSHTESEPFIQGGHHVHYPSKVYEENASLKATIRILRFAARLATTVIAALTAEQEARTIYNFVKTRDIIRDGRGPWSASTSLWPAILLLAVSIITFITGIFIIGAYAFSVKRANAISNAHSWFSYAVEAAHVITWIVVAILYRVGKTGNDLWGWACSPLAEQIQPNFEGVVNFTKVCKRGGRSWSLALASAGTQLLGFVIFIYMFRRWRLQKRIGKP